MTEGAVPLGVSVIGDAVPVIVIEPAEKPGGFCARP